MRDMEVKILDAVNDIVEEQEPDEPETEPSEPEPEPVVTMVDTELRTSSESNTETVKRRTKK